jgi:hypothetical protein
MPELVREHGFELRERQRVDERQADLEVLLRRDHEIQHRQIVEDGGIDARRQEHAMRPRRARLVGKTVQKGEEPRLLLGGNLDVLDLVAVLDEEQRLQHEDGEERGAESADEKPQRVVAADEGAGQEAPRGPGEPAGESEIKRDEGNEAGHGQPGVSPVARCGTGQGRGHGGGPLRISQVRFVSSPIAIAAALMSH